MAVAEVILACMRGYILIRACDTDGTEENLFINDLPGISSELIQVITEAEEETYLVTWSKIEDAAILIFRTRLLAQVNKCLQINKMATIECLACENKELLSSALWYLLGHQVMVWALFNWNNSKFSTVDRRSVEEIRDYYYSQFEIELEAAVMGIDIKNSDCINNEQSCVVPNGRIHSRYSLM